MALAVIAIHVNLFCFNSTYYWNIKKAQSLTTTILDIFTFNFLFLAVPVFFLISLFLFSIKCINDNNYFKHRLQRLLILYIFWIGIFLVMTNGQSLASISLNKPLSILIFMVSGGNSFYYFLFSLIVLTLITYFAMKLSRFVLLILLECSIFAICIILIFVKMSNSYHWLVVYWNPINFLPCVFIALLVVKNVNTEFFSFKNLYFKILILSLIVLFLIASYIELRLLPHRVFYSSIYCLIPVYTRVSVIIGSSILFLLSLTIKKPPHRWIRILSNYSLGLYCIHVFAIMAFDKIFGIFPMSSIDTIVKFTFVFGMSLLIVSFLKYALERKVI